MQKDYVYDLLVGSCCGSLRKNKNNNYEMSKAV